MSLPLGKHLRTFALCGLILLLAAVLSPAYASYIPITGEFQVNDANAVDLNDFRSDVGMLPNGGSVIVWQTDVSTTESDIVFKRYDSAGVQQGVQTLVHASNANDQRRPRIGVNPTNGNFVVVWESDQNGTYDIFARVFNAAGVPQTGEFQVNATSPAGARTNARVAINPLSGDFFVVYQGPGDDVGAGTGIFYRHFNASGVVQGSEFLVNVGTANNQVFPAIAMDGSGNFVVVWQTGVVSPANPDIAMRRFNAAGQTLTGDIDVSTASNAQSIPQIAMLPNGNFVVAWESREADGTNYQIYAKSVTAAAVQSAQTQISTAAGIDNNSPDLSMNSAGDAVLSWIQVNGAGDVQTNARLFTYGVGPVGSLFRVDTSGTATRTDPAIGISDLHQIAVAWSTGPDLFARMFADNADLVLTKASSVPGFGVPAGQYVPGANLQYTITVTNSGPSPVVGATVTDTIPAQVTGATWTCVASGTASCISGSPDGTGDSGAGNISRTVDIAAGGGNSLVFTVTGAVAANESANISNTASVTMPAGTSELNPADNTATQTDTPAPVADLQITKTDSPDPVAAGSNLTYTITVTNAGPSDASTVALSDVVPSNTTFVSLASPGGWACSTPSVGGTGTVSCNIATLTNAAVATFTLTVIVDPATSDGATITNTATIGAATFDPPSRVPNNNATATTLVSHPVPLIQISGNATNISSGDTTPSTTDDTDFGTTTVGTGVTHTFTITNTGTANLNIGSLTPPAGFTITSAAGSPVAPAGTTTFDLQCDAASAATFSGTVTIASDASNAPSFTFDVTCLVNPVPAPSIAVSGNATGITNGDNTPSTTDDTDFGTTTVGTVVTHTFTITNTGTANLNIGSVTPPAGFTITSAAGSPVAPAGTTTFAVQCDAASAATFTGTVTIASDASNAPSFTFDVTCLVNPVPAPSIAVSGNATGITNGDNTPSTTDDTDFGTTTVGTGVTHTFTITNTGTANLNIGSVTPPAGFTITSAAGSPVAPAGTTTFAVQCDAASAATFSGTVTIASDASNAPSFTFDVTCLVNAVPAPSIAVSGNATAISSGDTTPSTTDDTDFGTTTVGTVVTHTFTITNTGTANLNIGSVTPPAGFTVTANPGSPVAPAGTTTFAVQCDAASAATFSGTVTIASDASNAPSFTFDVTCLVNPVPAPSIAVSGNATGITNGDNTPSTTDDTDFGTTTVGTGVTHTFTITNTGTANLNIGSVTPPAGFTITSAAGSPVAPAGTTTFDLQCDAASAATFSGTVTIASDASNAPSFTFDVTCLVNSVPAPSIAVSGNATGITNGDTTPSTTDDTDFGTTTVGTVVTHTFTITNTGTANLNITSVTPPAGFTITSAAGSPVAPAGTTTFAVQCDAASAATFSGTVTIASDASNAPSFTFDVTCLVNPVGAATHLAFGQQPTDTAVNSPITPAVTVEIRDGADVLVTSDNTTMVTLAIGTNPSAGTLGGTLTVQVVNGVATFSDLTIDQAGVGYTLVATAPSLNSATSNPFNIFDIAPDQIVGRVFNDVNGNGTQEVGELGMNGVTVFLDTDSSGTLDAGEISTTTDASGNYAFAGLAAGTYNVTVIPASGFVSTTPVVVSPTVPTTAPVNFGLQTPSPTAVPPTGIPPTGIPPTPIIADPLITKTVFPPFAKAGEAVVWTITITNPAPVPATSVTVLDDIPGVVEIQSVSATSGTISFKGQLVTFTQPSVAPGQLVTITINTRVRPDAALPFVVTNTATITNAEVPNLRSAQATLTGVADLPHTGEPLSDATRLGIVILVLGGIALAARWMWSQSRR